MIFLQTSATTFHQIDAGEVVFINTTINKILGIHQIVNYSDEFEGRIIAELIRANPMISKTTDSEYLNRNKIDRIERIGYDYHAYISGSPFRLDPNCLLVHLTFKKSYVKTAKQYINNLDNQGIIDSIILGPGTVEHKIRRIAKEDIGETVNTYYINKRKRELKAKNK
jgi:hypothetical protein